MDLGYELAGILSLLVPVYGDFGDFGVSVSLRPSRPSLNLKSKLSYT